MMLQVVAVLLLAVIAYCAINATWRFRQIGVWLVEILKPKTYSWLDALVGQENVDRSVIDQLGKLMAQLDGRLDRIEKALADRK